MAKRQYSDNDKAAALLVLDANGGNVKRAARQARVPEKTLSDWAKNRGVNPDVAEIRAEKRKDLSERLEEIAHQCVDLLPGKLPDATTRDVAGVLIVAVDKMQLLKGEPTNITKELMQDSDRERIKSELRQKLSLVQKRA